MIEVKNLVKNFQPNKIAVDNVTFSIEQNEIFGILGANGAGKTTLIRLLSMQICPTSGEIFYNGKNLKKNETTIKNLIGVVPQHINFDLDLNVEENLELHARLYGMEKLEIKKRIAEMLEYMELSEFASYSIKKLSGGMKRRLLIARALIHRPQIIFLDEPTVALDPQVRRRIWTLIEELRKDGATIILTTHYIEEAEKLCQRTAIMKNGNIIAINSPQELCKQIGKFAVEFEDAGELSYKFFKTETAAKDFQTNFKGNSKIRLTTLEDVFVELIGKDNEFFSQR